MHASMRDSTVNVKTGTMVGGNPKADRDFTEYWTFLRRPGARAQRRRPVPKLRRALQGRLRPASASTARPTSRGQFDWVLSRIEQDEDYEG